MQMQEQAQEDAAGAAKIGGLVQVGQLGMAAAGTDIGKAAIKGVTSLGKSALGIGAASPFGVGSSAIGGASSIAAATPAAFGVQGAADMAISGMAPAIGGGGAAGGTVAGGSAVIGPGSTATTAGSAVGSAQFLGGAALASTAGSYIAMQISGDKDAGTWGNVTGGATYGGYVGGPLGAVAGALIGGVLSIPENYTRIEDEFKRSAKKVEREISRTAKRVGSEIERSVKKVGNAIKRIGKSLGSIICSELVEQGLLSSELRDVGAEYRKQNYSRFDYAGYLRWARPVVRLMKKSKIVTYLMYPVGVGWAKESAHKMYPEKYPSCWYGKIVMIVAPWFSHKVEMRYQRKKGVK
jgi:hypothetical protein